MPVKSNSSSTYRSHWLMAISCCCLLTAATYPSHADSLRQQIKAMAKSEGFVVEGMEHVGAEYVDSASGDATERVRTLLEKYNYLLILGKGGKIERLSITSLKDPNAKPRFNPVVETSRVGAHHQVQAHLIGPNGDSMETTLLIDTGATAIVLPESMIPQLGIDPAALEVGMSQTASDTIAVRNGTLRTVEIGQATAHDVRVSFIADSKLNGARLLGMSFLSRFRFSLDDDRNELTLLAK